MTLRAVNPSTLHATPGYSHVIEATGARTVYISGQVALDPSGNLVGPGDFEAQARQVFANLKAALEAVGGSFNDVAKLTYFVLDIKNLPAVRAIRDEFVNREQPPASSAIEVRHLFRDDILIEVEAVAVLSE